MFPEHWDPFQQQIYLTFTLISVAWGACIGSFLNVCIFRIPRELSVVAPRSFCPVCERPIPWYLNIPLFSYLLLRGRCHFCRMPFTARYLIVEALTALLFLLVWLQYPLFGISIPFGLTPLTSPLLVPVYWVFIAGLIMGSFVDFEHLIIPDRVTLGGIITGWLLSALIPEMHNTTSTWQSFQASVIGSGTGWFMLWGVAVAGRWIFKKEAMGFGDVKLLGAIGAFLGWQAVIFCIVISSFAGSIVGITLIALRKRGLQSRIPYGPYLALAAIIWIYWGPAIVQWYLNLLRPVGF